MHERTAVTGAVDVAFVHGAGFTGAVWREVQEHLACGSVALDLLGRGRNPFDLSRLTLEAAVARAVEDIEAQSTNPIVLVAHSVGGALSPGILRGLGPRAVHLVHVTAAAAEDGEAPVSAISRQVLDALVGTGEELRVELRGRTYADDGAVLPPGLRATQDEMAVTRIDSYAFGCVPTSWAGVDAHLPRTFVRTTRDRLYPPDAQDRVAAAMRADEVVSIDSGHNVARSAPAALAALLNDIVSRRVDG